MPSMITPSVTPVGAGSDTVLPVLSEHIVLTPGICGGKPRIAGHRIKVEHIVIWHERLGMSPAKIVDEHPGLTLGDVHAALAYYHDHHEAIDADIREGEEAFAQLKSQQPSILEKIAAKRPDVISLTSAAALAYLRSGFCSAEEIDRLKSDLGRREAEALRDPDFADLKDELSRR
jgi:uncharacterized protein (DUF433 family)